MNAELRRGACPSISQPMETGDGLLARLTLDWPDIEPAKLIAVLRSAIAHGNGIVEISTRGNLQIRGLTEQSANGFRDEIGALVLQSGGLPITLGGLAGLDDEEIANPMPVVAAIRGALPPKLLQALAPKTSIVVDGGGQISVDGIRGDIRLVAVKTDANPIWHISVGGNARDARPLGLALQSDVTNVVIELLTRLANKGGDARGHNLTEQELSELPVSPGNDDQLNRDRNRNAIGAFKLADKSLALGVAVPFGQCHAEDLLVLLQTTVEQGAKAVRFAPVRAVMVPGLDDSQLRAIKAVANDLGFVTEPDDPRLSVSACAGSPYCASAHLNTRELAGELLPAAGGLMDRSFTLHVSGCEKGCAHPAGPTVSIIGQPNSCQLRCELDGDIRAAEFDKDELPAVFSALNNRFKNDRNSDETASMFLKREAVERVFNGRMG